MSHTLWYLTIGVVLLLMAITAARLERWPLSTTIIYLAVGVLLGPMFANQFHFNPLQSSAHLEVFTEVAVLISLFAAGLKLAAPIGNRAWWVPFRLATVSMVATVLLTAAVAVWILGLPLGAAILLGAVLAPTDPVLATDVQVKGPRDRNHLRFALTGEAGLNDGTAFPMVMLGLGLLGLNDLGAYGLHWLWFDVVWACISGVGVGAAIGVLAGLVAQKMAARGTRSEFMEDFLGLGLIAVSYACALLVHGYGFLAVFSAGFMLHRTEAHLHAETALAAADHDGRPPDHDDVQYMSEVSLEFIEQLGRLGEVALLILIGGMLFVNSWSWDIVALALLLFFVVRPVSVVIGLLGSPPTRVAKAAIGWFGVRGIGSVYYLMYAIQHGVEEPLAITLISVVLVTITLSIVVHGTTVTPLMRAISRREQRHTRRSPVPSIPR